METRRDERISQLIQALKRSDKLHLKEAASLLGVSEMTIRRDLNGHSGPVVLLGGYIVLEPRSATHYLLSDQKTRLVEEKRRAARHAAALLEQQGCTLEVLARADDAVQVAIADADTHPSGNTDLLKNAMVASGFALEGDWYVLEQEETTP